VAKSKFMIKNGRPFYYESKRGVWPLYILNIAIGLTSVFFAEILYSTFDCTHFEVSWNVASILLLITGVTTGAFLASVFSFNYETSTRGWPWLLPSISVPFVSFIITILVVVTFFIAIAIGVLYGICWLLCEMNI